MLFLIVTMVISVLCVVFDFYDDVYRAFFLFLLVMVMFNALSVFFACYDDL